MNTISEQMPGESHVPGMRLQRFLAEAAIASRRHAETLIREGRVTVNGQPAEIGQKVHPTRDQVMVDNRAIVPTPHKVYLALHKPVGYTTSMRDRHAEHLISELVPSRFGRVFPVGRLDRDSSGLILLTNDGALAYRLTHPKFGVRKVYEVWVAGVPRAVHLRRMQEGMTLADGLLRADAVTVIRTEPTSSLLRVTLHEGRNREVRRLFEAIGHPVQSLKRVQFAQLRLDGLEPGRIRPLAHREVKALQQVVAEVAPRQTQARPPTPRAQPGEPGHREGRGHPTYGTQRRIKRDHK